MTPDEELIERLHRAAEYIKCLPLFEEAAARIDALAAENERLTADESASNKALVHANILAGQRAERAEAALSERIASHEVYVDMVREFRGWVMINLS